MLGVESTPTSAVCSLQYYCAYLDLTPYSVLRPQHSLTPASLGGDRRLSITQIYIMDMHQAGFSSSGNATLSCVQRRSIDRTHARVRARQTDGRPESQADETAR
jgi:hypothetical protein